MPKFGGASFSTPKLVYGLVLSLKPASPATLKYTFANLLWVSVLASLSTTLQSLLENWNSFRSTGGDEYSDWKLVRMHVAPCRPTGTLLPSRQPIKLKHGETHQLRRGTNWWLFGLTIAKLLYCHQTLVWTRQSQYDGWRKLLTLRAFHPYVQSVHGRCWSERPVEILLSLWSLRY